LVAILVVALAAFGQALDPQSVSRAGVHDLFDKSDALNFNPAILGPDRGYTATWELPSLGLGIANNSFSVGYWNKHFAGDHNYKASEIRSILDQIPGSGIRGDMQMALPVLGFGFKHFGARIAMQSAGTMNLPKDLAVLALTGNDVNRMYNFGTLEGTGQAVVDYGAGFAYRFDQEKIPDLYFGAGFHFYQGVALAKSEQVSGSFKVNMTDTTASLVGGGVFHSVTSTRGDGVGFDLGAMAVLNDKWEVGLSAQQIGARITWDVKENKFVSGFVDSSGIQLGSKVNMDSTFHKVDTTYGGGTVETQLPVVLQANGRYKLSPKANLLGDIAVRTSTTVQGRSGLEVGVAGQYFPVRWWVVQGGISVGGLWGSRFGAGTGFHFKHYLLDLGGSWAGGAFNGARGVGFAFSQRLLF
jgi:hypothetical protein